MFTKRLFNLFAVIALLLVSACTPQVAATPEATPEPVLTTARDEPMMLRMAVADPTGAPSEPYVLEFIEQVKTLSNGSIAIEVTWDPEGFEVGTIQLVKKGKAELGLAGSRAFDMEGVTSFQALQAPFLIDNDALSKDVATSDISTRMLDSLSPGGIVGLALWPEDLRHPFSVIPSKVLLSPEDLTGLNIRATPSSITYLLIETLGGKPVFGQNYEGAESGLRQGASLTGAPTATGNVTFFAKYQVLFASGAALEKLSENQRAILRNAAAATQKKAIADHPSESQAGNAWCADGGSIVMASEEQIAAFENAAQPVFDSIAQDPFNAEMIAAIRELKATTEPSQGAEACIGVVVQPAPDPSTYANGLLNGTWDYVMSEEDKIILDAAGLEAESGYKADELRIRMGFNNHAWWQGFVFDGELWLHNGVPEGDGGTFRIEDDRLIQTGDQGQVQVTYAWVLDGDQLTLTVVEECDVTPTGLNCRDDRAQMDQVMIKVTEHTYTRSGAGGSEVWSEGLPPNGNWRVELTVDDFINAGVSRPRAMNWVGIYEYVFEDGKGMHRGSGPWGNQLCPFTAELIEDFVRITFVDQGLGNYQCGIEHDDLQWRLDADGLHFNLVANNGDQLAELTVMYEAKPWQKVE